MGLKGSLRDFGISEILQLIGLQRKSGVLEVKGREAHFRVMINGGKIVGVEKEPELKSEGLSEYLVRAKMISGENFSLAQQKSKSELKPLEAVLVELGFISSEELKSVISLRNIDLLNQLFLLKEGEYEFEAGPVTYHPNYCAELETEQVLMDGYRVRDESGLILKEIGDQGIIFQKKPGEFGADQQLDPIVNKVYRLVNGERGIDEIARLARLSRFDTLKILVELKNKDRIEPKTLTRRESGVSGKIITSAVFIQVGFWLGMVIFLGLLSLGLFRYQQAGFIFKKPSQETRFWNEEMVRQGLEVYRLERGGYPEQLGELLEAGLLSERDLQFLQNYQYYKQGGGYKFVSPELKPHGL